MSKVVLSELQHGIFDFGRATTARACATAAAKRAAVVKEGDLAKAGIQANPVKVSKTSYTEFKAWLDNKSFKVRDIPTASNITTS
eukprot:2751864-Pyramimonas_sp.AAC.2